MRKPMTEEKLALEVRRAKRFNDTAFIVTIVFIAVFSLFIWLTVRYTTFSPKRWKTDPEHRSAMIFSLLTQHKLYGMEKAQVQELLGYDQHRWENADNQQLTYYLGHSAIGEKEKWLILDLQNNLVTGFYFQTE